MSIDNLANLAEALINLIQDILTAINTTIISAPAASEAATVTASDISAFKVSIIVIIVMVLLLIFAQHGGARKKAKR